DGVRFAFAWWPMEKTRAERACKSLGEPLVENGVFAGAVVKSNAPVDRRVKTFVRDQDSGLLVDRTEQILSSKPPKASMEDMLVDAIKDAAWAGQPFKATG